MKKAYSAAESWGEAELAAALVRLAELDVALKGGSPLPDELEAAVHAAVGDADVKVIVLRARAGRSARASTSAAASTTGTST